MDRRVLYEAGFTLQNAWFVLILLLIVFLCILIRSIKKLKNHRKYGSRAAKTGVVIGALGILGLAAVTALVVPGQIKLYQSTVGAYKNGDYQIVEGYVEQFRPAQKVGSAESFTVNGVEFKYYDNVAQFGYHSTSARGGVITGDGQHLRIGYTHSDRRGNVIVYIEEL